VCGRNLITGLTSATSPRADISSTCKVGQKVGVSLPLLTCSSSAWASQLLYCRGRKSQRDLWITLYIAYTYSKFSTKIYGYTIRYFKIPLQWKVKVKNFQHRCNVNLWYSKYKNTEMYNHTPSLPHQHSECETHNITVTSPYQNYVPPKFRVLFCLSQIPEQYTW
jgi:hypothetical protein